MNTHYKIFEVLYGKFGEDITMIIMEYLRDLNYIHISKITLSFIHPNIFLKDYYGFNDKTKKEYYENVFVEMIDRIMDGKKEVVFNDNRLYNLLNNKYKYIVFSKNSINYIINKFKDMPYFLKEYLKNEFEKKTLYQLFEVIASKNPIKNKLLTFIYKEFNIYFNHFFT